MDWTLQFNIFPLENRIETIVSNPISYFKWQPYIATNDENDFTYTEFGIKCVPDYQTVQPWQLNAKITWKFSSTIPKFHDHIFKNDVIFSSNSSSNGQEALLRLQRFEINKLKDLETQEKRLSFSCKVKIRILHISGLPESLVNFFDPELKDADVVFKVEGVKFYAHKSSINSQSVVLRGKIEAASKKSSIGNIFSIGSKSVKLDDETPERFLYFLRSLYQWNFQLTDSNLRIVLEAAVRYQAQSIIDRCEQYILFNLEQEMKYKRTSGERPFCSDSTLFRDALKDFFKLYIFHDIRAGNYTGMQFLTEVICYAGTMRMKKLLERCILSIESISEFQELEKSTEYIRLNRDVHHLCEFLYRKSSTGNERPLSTYF